jgi:hypothetical protein
MAPTIAVPAALGRTSPISLRARVVARAATSHTDGVA